MAEVFTISGPADVAPVPLTTHCPGTKSLLVAGGTARLGGLGLGGYGVYKAFHKGWGPAVLSFVGAAALWFSGGRILRAYLTAEAACKGGPQ